MELEELEGWAESFAAFCARFDDLFARSESRLQARKYLRGLLAGLERKTTWQLAEVVKDGTPDRMQRLLYRVRLRRGGRPRPLATVRHPRVFPTQKPLPSSMKPVSPRRALVLSASTSNTVARLVRSRTVRWPRC